METTDNSTVTLSMDQSTVTLSTDNSTVNLSTDIENCTITTSTDTNSCTMASSSDTNSYKMIPSTDISSCLMTSSSDTSSCMMTSLTDTTSCIMTLSMDTNSNMTTSSMNSNSCTMMSSSNTSSCTITSSTEADSNSVPLDVVISTQSQPKKDNRNDIFTYNIPLTRAIPLESYVIASSVYIMIDEFKTMDADRRLMWYLKRLGTVQMVDEKFDEDIEMEEPCKIMSFIPRKERKNKKTSFKNTNFVMDTFTRVYFMTPVYNMVYCLDMSPSNCTVDIQRGYVMLDEMMVALRRSIEGFIRPFIVPGSKKILFEPQVYVTVIVHTPFFTSLAQQVLVQGWLINSHNFVHFFRTISFEMNRLESSLAKTKIVIVTTESCDNENNTSENESEIHKNLKFNINKSSYNRTSCSEDRRPGNNKNNPDSGFINTLRYGMLAVRLLPPSNLSNLVVITDGMISLADIQVLDSVLNQLRSIGVACSFLHVSSQFHPNSSHGLVPYPELMQLIATATYGAYLNSFPKTLPNLVVNYYHTKFIMWSFKRGDAKESPITKLSCTPPRVRPGEWTIRNSSFYGNREPQLVSKKQISDHVHAHLENIICSRMREGFLVKDIQLKDAGNNNNTVLDINNPCKLQLKLVLPWTNHVYIEYDIATKWPPPVMPMEPIVVQNTPEKPSDSTTESKQVPPKPQPDDSLNIHYTVVVKGPYEFLHDITCNKTKKYFEQSQSARSYKFQLSSCRSSSISFAAATTTITKKTDYIMSDRPSTRVISSMYRQALIARFWSTMQSIVQTDVLIKHLETYSPSTGHLFDSENQPKQQTENPDLSPLKLEIPSTTEIDEIDDICLSPLSVNSIIDQIVMAVNNDGAESKSTVNLAIPGALNKSPLLNGVPLFYHLPLNSNYYFSLKQNKVKLDGQQKNYIDQQHQQFVDFWKPVCTLDPESQWPKWFSTYRIGGGVLLLRHDRPLPHWLHMPNIENEPYTMTVTCRKAAKSLFVLLKHWCTFVLIDDHSYVKCLDKNETLTGNLSFCIARISLKAPSCCCVVLHLAFQSCVPASVHYEIIDELRNKIILLDSTTVGDYVLSTDDQQQQSTDEKQKPEELKKEETESKVKKKSSRLKKYVNLLDKPLEKILVRYERIPSQFTTVIFPDGSQPNPGVSVCNLQNTNYKSKRRQLLDVSPDISTKVELKAVTATTTLSRYLYHRRWIWSSGRSYYSNCFSNVSPNIQLQLARTLSVLTNVRLKEGFRFAHSSTGILNMVLQVDMIEGSKACPSTPTSQCLIQYVIFPPNISHKFRTKYNDNVRQITLLKKNNVDDKSTSTSSIEDASQKQKKNMITSESGDSNDCYSLPTTEDDYQLITECWIEPQHGLVVVNKKQNNKYMVGLNYEQLADALWRVDSDCIGSLFTFQHMQHMCKDPNMSVSDLDVDLDKSVIVDAGRIHKLPFTFSLVKVLPKCRHHSSMTFSLFTKCEEEGTDLTTSVKDHKKMNSMLERSFYSRLQTINDRAFDVNDSEYSDESVYNMNRPTVKMNEQEIGQCFMKRVDDTRLILTITPLYAEENSTIEDNFFEDGDFDIEPFVNRSRAYTWHYTKRNVGGQSTASLNAHQQENNMNYYRTMSVGSTPYYSDTNNLTWAQLRLDRNLCNFDNKDTKNCSSSGLHRDLQDVPTIMNIEVYDCRQQDIENVLTSDSDSYDHTIIDNYINEYSNCSSLSSSDENEEENDEEKEKEKEKEKEEKNISIQEQFYYNEPAVDPMLMDKYLHKVKLVYNHSYVTTVFHALHLGFNVPYMDIQRAVDRCQHRLVSFEITDYLKVVCNHFKTNSNSCTVCSAENHVLKSHHDEIHSTFSSTLNRYMLKPVLSHPDYYFYDYIEKLDEDEDGYCVNYRMSENDTSHKQEVDEQDLFPLFVHLVCTVKTKKFTKSQSVRSLPTCIFELLNQDVENESIRNLNLSNVKVSLDVYCLMLPNNDYEYDCDDEEDDDDRYYQRSYSDKLHFPIINNSVKQTKQNPFIYLCYSIPSRHAQGLAEFIAEVEWCMRDEMAAGLLKDPIVTPHTLEKLIEHISSSPNSSSNEHRQIPLNFVLPSPLIPTGYNKYDSLPQFLQKLDQLEIILDHDYGDRFYSIEKSTENTFYIVKKDLQFSPDSTGSEMINYEDTEINFDPEVSLSYTEHYKTVLPNFWVILKVLEDQKDKHTDNNNSINKIIVNVYFHCRFSELDIQEKYSVLREVLGKNLRQAAIKVNQTILLHHLHDTRTCDPFLEPIIEDLIYSDEDENAIGQIDIVKNHFNFGQFRCPVVWSTRFSLHPRLQHSTSMLLLGVQVLHTVLDKFSVRNRRNMFVYKDSNSSVFYLRFYENSSRLHQNNMAGSLQYDSDDEDSISRCSSATSTTATVSSSINPPSYTNFPRKYSENNPGTRSNYGYWGDTDSKDIEDLILRVHGISPVSNEICIDLVEVLQNRLNDAVLEVLTTMLYRNPLCKLYPDDIRYIQPYNSQPDFTMKLSLPIETKITKSFSRNLKRSAAALLLYPPKYGIRYHRFYCSYDALENPVKPIIRSFFMYNQSSGGTSGASGMRGTSGNRGLACVVFDIYSNEYNSRSGSVDDNSYDYPIDLELFKKRVHTKYIENSAKSNVYYSGYVNVFVWRRGRINTEALQTKLNSTITHSLWDIYMERFLWEQPIIIEQPSEAYVNPLCIQYLAKWIAFGAHISAPLAVHSRIDCEININHVLREFKTHLSWLGSSTSNNLTISVRYFYVPDTQYKKSSDDCVGNNSFISLDPFQLEQRQDTTSTNNPMFYEWKIPDNDLVFIKTEPQVICPPSAASVLIIVSVTSTMKTKQKQQTQLQNRNIDEELSDSDTDNGVPEVEKKSIPSEDDFMKMIEIDNDQSSMTLKDHDDYISENNSIKENTALMGIDSNKYEKKKQPTNNSYIKTVKLLMLAISEQSIQTLSYNYSNSSDQSITIQCLSRWLEWRHLIFMSSIYHKLGLTNRGISYNSSVFKSRSTKCDLDLLLDYKSYVAAIGANESTTTIDNNSVTLDKYSRKSNSRTKPTNENDTEDKKNKSIQYTKDFQDTFLEQLVRNNKQQHKIDAQKKVLYDMWIQSDAIITKENLRIFFNHSRVIHYCLTPLLFLPRWRLELSATRDNGMDSKKIKHFPSLPPPHWHKRLCAQLTTAYADFIETSPVFNGFQLVHIGKRGNYDCKKMEKDGTKSTICYFKKSVPGVTGGLLLLETGVCPPFYFIKLCSIERARLTNQPEIYDNIYLPLHSLLDQSETIIRNMHLHSFTYDFHVKILSERLTRLIQKQKIANKKNYSCDLFELLEQSSTQGIESKSESDKTKNSISRFLDDFLKYYTIPPIYSCSLVLAGCIKHSQIPVTGIQLYRYLLENCVEEFDGMAVIKICDNALLDGDDVGSLFDEDDKEYNEFQKSQNYYGNDLTDFILVHRMTGSDIQKRQKLEIKSNYTKLGLEYTNSEIEVCGLYDATLIITLSSVEKLLLEVTNEIQLSYYVLLTNNENDNLEKKDLALLKTDYNVHQRHNSTPMHPYMRGFNNSSSLSHSVPSDSFGNAVVSYSATFLENFKDELNNHCQQKIKKTNLIKFYEKKSTELVAYTIDTAANHCRIHLLWESFSIQPDHNKPGTTANNTFSIDELKIIVNKSGLVEPLAAYDNRLKDLIEEFFKLPQWFSSFHKLISGQTYLSSSMSSTLPPPPPITLTTTRCRIYNHYNSDRQYLVILPYCSEVQINVFIVLDNGGDPTDNIARSSNSLINIVFKRNKNSSEEVNMLVETVVKTMCVLIWRAAVSGNRKDARSK